MDRINHNSISVFDRMGINDINKIIDLKKDIDYFSDADTTILCMPDDTKVKISGSLSNRISNIISLLKNEKAHFNKYIFTKNKNIINIYPIPSAA